MDTSSKAVSTPAGPEESARIGVRLAGHVIRLAAIAGFLAWFVPDSVRLVGYPKLASRIAHDGLLRAVMLPITFALLVAGHVMARGSRKDPRRGSARRPSSAAR